MDKATLVEVMLRVGGPDGLLMALEDEVAEADLNPVIVSATGAVAGAAVASGAFGVSGAAVSPASFAAEITPIASNTFTGSPSLMRISVRIPAAGEGSSVLTLSVMISTIGSSSFTASPTALSQRLTVPSWTDSPSSGIKISVGMVRSLVYRRVTVGLRWVCGRMAVGVRSRERS